jgi:ubiquinone/menaquinone biosynthesis C-methylase UbiE
MTETSEIVRFYETHRPERSRITEGAGRLEFLRTQEVVRRHMPPPPARVLDVGGGEGVHAAWLAAGGYDVHLVDLVAAHVEQAIANSVAAGRPFTAARGDARSLEEDDQCCDAVLLLGPAYHLTEETDRVRALTEARRVVRPGGVVFVAAISRYASLFAGLALDDLFDPRFRAIVERDVVDGQHRNPAMDGQWFTTAYFHRPDELVAEASSAGLAVRELVGLEGMAGWLPSLEARFVDDPDDRETILWSARVTEQVPALAALSAHMLLVAERT